MIVGGGKIAFAHVEEVIDFASVNDIKRYVAYNEEKGRLVFYLDKNGKPNRQFSENFIYKTANNQYSISVWVSYNGLPMGC